MDEYVLKVTRLLTDVSEPLFPPRPPLPPQQPNTKKHPSEEIFHPGPAEEMKLGWK